MSWYLMALKRYAEFNGRSRRKEYWMFTLFNIVFVCIPYIAGMALMANQNSVGMVLMGLVLIYDLAVLIPCLAVSVRRLHDIGKSGWWILIALVPFVGGIVLLVFMCMEGQPGDNQYGPNPKAAAPAAIA